MKFKEAYTEERLSALRDSVGKKMSGKKFSHTLAVEREAVALAEIYAPETVPLMRAAALLHDITKEYEVEKQLQILKEFGIITKDVDICSGKTLHSKTAAALIPVLYPEYADEAIISAVAKHTTGAVDMTLSDRLIFLADYIEDTRTFEDCVKLRDFFYSGIKKAKSYDEKYRHLTATLIYAFDLTMTDIITSGKILVPETNDTRNALLLEFANKR